MGDAPQVGHGAGHQPLREAALCLLAAALSTAIASTALLATPRFFFTDDYVTYFLPGFREIGRMLARGEFPLLTDRIWVGGDLLQEYQFAVFNPVSLALYWLISRFSDLAAASAVFSLTHIAILAAGAYALARNLGCARRHAVLVGVFAPLADWIFYWGAANWIGALVSMAWLSWAWALLVLAARRGAAWVPLAAASVAMVLVSGWPFANLALLISVMAAGVGGIARGGRWLIGPTLRVLYSLLVGALLAAPAIVPVQQYLRHAFHSSDPGLWAAGLDGLLGMGIPDFVTHWRTLPFEYGTARLPMVYAAWFAPIALVNADWAKAVKTPSGLTLVLATALLAVVAMHPGFGQFRWMFRLLPYYQMAILVLSAWTLTQAEVSNLGWRLGRTAIVVGAEVWLALTEEPAFRAFYVLVGVGLALAAWAGAKLVGRRDWRWTAFAILVGLAAFQTTLWRTVAIGYPLAPNHWKPPTVSALRDSAKGRTRYSVFRNFGANDPGLVFWTTFSPANTALEQPGASAQGYSPILRPEISQYFCENHFGTECTDLVARLTVPIAPTTSGLIDLMAIGEVAIQQPDQASAFWTWARGRWSETRGPAGEWRFDRIGPSRLLTWASPGASGLARSAKPARIVARVRNDAPTPAILVFSRAWYPGWRASLNGKSISANPLAGFLVSVRLPPRSSGELVLAFWPDGLTVGLLLAALGGLALLVGVARPDLIDKPIAVLERRLDRKRA
ncbi:MAG TPA: hypothetical protein VIF38_08715 [Burkholderiales bacterium]|jgi:hypothetical protein